MSVPTPRSASALVLVMLLVSAALLTGRTAEAQAGTFLATLSGDRMIPPVTTNSSGIATATLAGATVTYTLRVDAISDATQAHVHLGKPDVNGPIVAFLFGPEEEGVDSIDVSGTLGPADLTGPLAGDPLGFANAVLSGETYIVVHTLANPAGEIRGTITMVEAETAEGTTPSELPATGSGGLADDASAGGRDWSWLTAAALSAVLLVGGALTVTRRR